MAIDKGDTELADIAKVAEHVRDHPGKPSRTADLAAVGKLRPTQIARGMRPASQVSTTRFARKVRIDKADRPLRGTPMAIADVAFECGYGDQTALTRQFCGTVGMPLAANRDPMKEKKCPA